MKIQLRSVEVFDNPSTLAVGRSWSSYPAIVCAYAKTECAALNNTRICSSFAQVLLDR
ncbi:hypothetical protein BPNPMPFG_007856 (plasmid) [Mesorhizobium sp. AR07]|uniref:hypothetical protein n=1 Tax=Mesorhizobium sp. AR07 TaxID=2865838 RepID=UPI00215FA02C|nr:hypothetical protein [Mesorhizobium sp. AR07]UVK48477.1 hypothetical protein BPNPMPFG_007856 [Mesorhizobium sp. AR07]